MILKVYTSIDEYYYLRSDDIRPDRILEEGHSEITKVDMVVSNNDLIMIVDNQPQFVENYQDILNERQWNFIREERNRMLVETDWTQLADVPLSEEKKNAWKIYRQALRDTTLQKDPHNIIWPIKP
jgi:hypothetical protein